MKSINSEWNVKVRKLRKPIDPTFFLLNLPYLNLNYSNYTTTLSTATYYDYIRIESLFNWCTNYSIDTRFLTATTTTTIALYPWLWAWNDRRNYLNWSSVLHLFYLLSTTTIFDLTAIDCNVRRIWSTLAWIELLQLALDRFKMLSSSDSESISIQTYYLTFTSTTPTRISFNSTVIDLDVRFNTFYRPQVVASTTQFEPSLQNLNFY